MTEMESLFLSHYLETINEFTCMASPEKRK